MRQPDTGLGEPNQASAYDGDGGDDEGNLADDATSGAGIRLADAGERIPQSTGNEAEDQYAGFEHPDDAEVPAAIGAGSTNGAASLAADADEHDYTAAASARGARVGLAGDEDPPNPYEDFADQSQPQS